MYRIGIIINENEASHSKYADSEGVLESAIKKSNDNGRKGNSYEFVSFDKFNIQTMFESGDNGIHNFDGIFIATNAVSRGSRIHKVLCKSKGSIEDYVNTGKGLFVSSQKKLSNGSLLGDEYTSSGFLPSELDYYIFDRPDKFSGAGTIKIANKHVLLDHPFQIGEELIAEHCENNQFMTHRYRSLIIPKHPNAYVTLLCDNVSKKITYKGLNYFENDRKLLLASRSNKRVVLTTMAVDWANHEELLSNILTYIVEDKPRIVFVKKKGEVNINTVIDTYIVRANIVNLPYRVFLDLELQESGITSGSSYVFSPAWSADEIEGLYRKLVNGSKEYFSLYHISSTDGSSINSHKLSKYSNFSSVDTMKDAVIENLLSRYLSNSWGKSVWTYSYILKLTEFYGLNINIIAKSIYTELSKHFTKKDDDLDNLELIGSYDNVTNATCKMLGILRDFSRRYHATKWIDYPYKIGEVIDLSDEWILDKIEGGTVYGQDICYCLEYLTKYNIYETLGEETQNKIVRLFIDFLNNIIEEIVSSRILKRPTIDLARIYHALCMLTPHDALPEEKTVMYLQQIELIISHRQDTYGSWKSITETAEIISMLLEACAIRSEIDISIDVFNTMLAKGVESLHSTYDGKSSMWSSDLGSTAKAMYSIGLYDKLFSFAINDFFDDLQNSRGAKASEFREVSAANINGFFEVIDKLEREKDELMVANEGARNTVSESNAKISKYRKRALALKSILAILSLTIIIIIAVLYINHKAVFSAILDGWNTYLIGALFGLVISAIYGAINR